jgi:hypothetical protein
VRSIFAGLLDRAATASVRELRIAPPRYSTWLTMAGIARIQTDIAAPSL